MKKLNLLNPIGCRTKWFVVAAVTVGILAAASATSNAEREGGKLQQKNPNVNYTEFVDFTVPVNPIPEGNTVSTVTAVDYFSVNSGCEVADFARFPGGDISLVSRGTCLFAVKVLNAQAAGASGVLIANNRAGIIFISLANAVGIVIPVLSITEDLGAAFEELTAGGLRAHMQVKHEIPTQ